MTFNIYVFLLDSIDKICHFVIYVSKHFQFLYLSQTGNQFADQ